MAWYPYVACFLAGCFLVNALPHFIKGVCGEPFPTPFAKPPGKGLSSPVVNVLWSLSDFALAWVFLYSGDFFPVHPSTLIVFIAGIILMSLQLSFWFGKQFGKEFGKQHTS